MIAAGPIASTAILGMIFEGLKDQGAISFQCLYENLTSDKERSKAVEGADVLFIFRSCFPWTLSLLRLAKKLGKATIFSTDDDFLLLDKNSKLGKIFHDPENVEAYESLFKEADLVWLFNEEMIRRYQHLNPRIILGKSPSPLEVSADTTEPFPNDKEPMTIGYAGRFLHGKDLRVAVKPLLNLLRLKGDDLRLEFIDCIPEEFRGHPQVTLTPFFKNLNDFYAYMRQAKWSIGLALLEDTPFNRCKTNNKYREYASFGIPAIYSDMPVYSSCVKHGLNGYLASHTEDGIQEALEVMLSNPILRQKIRMEALQDVSCNYSLKGAQLQVLSEVSLLAIEKIRNLVKKPKLLIIGYETVSSTHIDALQPCRELQRSGLLEFTWKNAEQTEKQDLEMTDSIYLVREFEKANIPYLKWARQGQIPLICSWDDNFFLLPEDTPLGQVYAQPETRRTMEKFLRKCSLIMASTRPLADYSRNFNKHVMEAIYGLKPPDSDDNIRTLDNSPSYKIRIGFFGSNRAIEEPFIIEALKDIRNRYQDKILIEMIGLKPTPEVMAFLDSFIDIVWNYDEALNLLKSRCWDIALAPLSDTEFNSAKQATKFRDYAWCGASIIASDVPAYRRTMVNGLHGLLVENTSSAWIKAIVSLIEDPDKRNFIERGAKLLLENVHLQNKTIASWHQLIWRIMKFKLDKNSLVQTSASDRFLKPRRNELSDPFSSLSLIRLSSRDRLNFQIWVQEPNWNRLDVFIESQQRLNKGKLTLLISTTSGSLLRQATIDLSQVSENNWLKFCFAPITNSASVSFKLEFAVTETPPGTFISFFERTPDQSIRNHWFRNLKLKRSKKVLHCRPFHVDD